MLGWFRALMPREERFFDLFARHAQVTLAGAEALRALLKGGDNVVQCCRAADARRRVGVLPLDTVCRGQFLSSQLLSAALYSLGHGGNDAQKTMGIIAVLLFSQGLLGETFYIPFWVVLICQAAMALGTLLGGWRIVRTMGSRITRLHPVQGFCAEAGGSITLFLATFFGVPVSTTHTITGAIVGVGAARKVAGVRWNVASNVVVAWIVTLPAAAGFGAAFYGLYRFLS